MNIGLSLVWTILFILYLLLLLFICVLKYLISYLIELPFAASICFILHNLLKFKGTLSVLLHIYLITHFICYVIGVFILRYLPIIMNQLIQGRMGISDLLSIILKVLLAAILIKLLLRVGLIYEMLIHLKQRRVWDALIWKSLVIAVLLR